MWAVDRKRRRLPFDVVTLNPDVILENEITYEAYLRMKESSERLRAPPKFKDDADFEEWDSQLMSVLDQTPNLWLFMIQSWTLPTTTSGSCSNCHMLAPSI